MALTETLAKGGQPRKPGGRPCATYAFYLALSAKDKKVFDESLAGSGVSKFSLWQACREEGLHTGYSAFLMCYRTHIHKWSHASA